MRGFASLICLTVCNAACNCGWRNNTSPTSDKVFSERAAKIGKSSSRPLAEASPLLAGLRVGFVHGNSGQLSARCPTSQPCSEAEIQGSKESANPNSHQHRQRP